MSHDNDNTTIQHLPGGGVRVNFGAAQPPADNRPETGGNPAARGDPNFGGTWNAATGEFRPHAITRSSTADLSNGHEGILATARTPSGRPATVITDDTVVTIQGMPMSVRSAIHVGLLTRSQLGIVAEAPPAPTPAPRHVDPADTALESLEVRLGPAMATRITEDVLHSGSLESIDPSVYAFTGLSREEFIAMASPAFARTQQRVEQTCGGPALADSLHYWCSKEPERAREYLAATRELHHTGDASRLDRLMAAFHRA